MKTLTIIFIFMLLFVPCLAAENQQPDEIDKYIAQQHRNIENYYESQLIELNQRAQSDIRMLEVADKALYSGTYKAIYTDLATKTIYADFTSQADVAKTVLHIDNYGYRAPWFLSDETERMLQLKDDFQDSINQPSKRFAVAYSRIAERKNEILANMEWETSKLLRQKKYALTDGLAKLEKQLQENAAKPKPEVTHGLVTGILYSADKPAAVVGGKIVHQGTMIDGVTVVKIYRDKVEFAKNRKKWMQKVQEKPASYW
jgi:hypothetical protein